MREGGITAAGLRMLALACVAGAVAAELSGGASAVRSPCPDATVRTGQTGTWTTQPAPKFPAGDSGIVSYAVDASDPRHRYVTNGTAILGSQDGGCNWKAVFVIPDAPSQAAPYARSTSKIVKVAAAGGRGVASVSAPPVQETGVGVNGDDPARSPQLVSFIHSTEADGNWQQSDMTPHPGEPGDLVVSTLDTKIVYAAAGSTVFRSNDGGASFAPATPTDALSLTIRTIAVDPLDPGQVFAANVYQLFRSTNGGQTWQQYSQQEKASDATIGPVVGREAGTPRKVTLVRTKLPADDDGSFDGLAVSENGGAAFTAISRDEAGAVSGMPLSVVGSSRREDLIVTTSSSGSGGPAGIFRRSPGSGRLVAVDEFNLAPLTASQAESKGARIHFFAPDKLVAFDPPSGDLQPEAKPPGRPTLPPSTPEGTGGVDAPPVALEPLEEAKPPVSTLVPQGPEVTVPVGETVSADFALGVDPRPLPLDVFFLLDTSGSTDPYIQSLKDSLPQLANSLNRAGVDPRFGLGEYNDTGGGGGTARYRRLVDIGPAEALIEPLQRIRTAGGSEPGYTAEHQVATGSGIDSGTLPVKRGQQANWRTGSVRLVVHIADEPFARDPAGPDRDQTVAALQARDIHVVGLQAADTPNALMPLLVHCGEGPDPEDRPEADLTPTGEGQLRCMLTDLARETRAFATRDVDCDGDRLVDVKQGEPLVCVILREDVLQLAPEVGTPVYELGMSLADRQPAELVVSDTPVTVEVVPAADYSELDMQKRNDLPFQVRFSCKPEIRGQTFELSLQARVAGLLAAESKPRVVCDKEKPAIVVPPPGRAAKVPKPKPAEQPVPRPVIAPAPPPIAPATTGPQLPPPAPIPQVQPAQAAQPAAAQAPASAQVQAPASVPGTAAAAQEEEAPAAILARVELNEEEEQSGPGSASLSFSAAAAPDTRLAFSAHAGPADGSDGDLAWLIRVLGVAGVLGLAGAAARTRPRRTPSPRAFVRDTPAPARRSSPRRRKRTMR